MTNKNSKCYDKSKITKHVQTEHKKDTLSTINEPQNINRFGPDAHYDEAHYDEILKNIVCFDSTKYTTHSVSKKNTKKSDIFEKCKELELELKDKPSTKKSNHGTKKSKNNMMTTDLLDKFVQTYDDL